MDGKLISTHPSRTVTLDTIDDDDDEDPDEVAAFLPIFLPIDRNYESKYLFQFVDKRRSRIKKRTLQEGQSELPGVGINKVAGKPELRTFGVNRN